MCNRVSTLESDLSLTFELKIILKSVPVEWMLDLVPRIAPIMIAPMNRIVNMQIGMMNPFF